MHLQYLYDGFTSHHSELVTDPPRKAMYDAQEWFGNTCFTIPSFPALDKRRSAVKKSWSFSKRTAFKSQKSKSMDLPGGQPPPQMGITVPGSAQQTVI